MSDSQLISIANLTLIERNLDRMADGLNAVQTHVRAVDEHVDAVGKSVSLVDTRLDSLARDFEAFVKSDLMAKQLQLAETRIVKVRQQLEHDFGHYSEVRRRTTGILQASDVALVRQETVSTITEELMLAAPRYWLAPALVAIAAWLGDNQGLAERAAGEALRRNETKTALFFALLGRRLGRPQVSRLWLDRFFNLQDPTALEREVVILIDALAGGVFGPEARTTCSETLSVWIEELSNRAGFEEEQQQQWERALESKMRTHDSSVNYTYLPKYSPTWTELQQAMVRAQLHEIIRGYFEVVFAGEIPAAASIVIAVDDLLEKLVTEFDDEELPLRRDERLLSLIIEEGGDKDAAERRAGLETEALAERVSFTQLLTNAAMHPETSGASKATQRYAISLSRDWIIKAHNDITLRNRQMVPPHVTIEIGEWAGVTRDGSNEADLLEQMNQYLERLLQKALTLTRLQPRDYLAGGAGALLFLWGVFELTSGTGGIGIILGLAGIAWFLIARSRMRTAKARIIDEHARAAEASRKILNASLAEVADWRRAYAAEDEKAKSVTQLLESLTPAQYVLSRHDTARALLA